MSPPFRLATFNLENLDWSRTHEMEFVRRMAVLKLILNDLAADVICLQEVAAQKSPPVKGAGFLLLIVSSVIRLTKITIARRAFGPEPTRQRMSIIW